MYSHLHVLTPLYTHIQILSHPQALTRSHIRVHSHSKALTNYGLIHCLRLLRTQLHLQVLNNHGLIHSLTLFPAQSHLHARTLAHLQISKRILTPVRIYIPIYSRTHAHADWYSFIHTLLHTRALSCTHSFVGYLTLIFSFLYIFLGCVPFLWGVPYFVFYLLICICKTPLIILLCLLVAWNSVFCGLPHSAYLPSSCQVYSNSLNFHVFGVYRIPDLSDNILIVCCRIWLRYNLLTERRLFCL